MDRVITLFGRHRAPVIQSHYLHPGEQAFVMLGLVPNRKGQPLLVDWQVASRLPGQPFTLEPYEAFVPRAGLKAGQLPNPGVNVPLQALQTALPQAVAGMRQHMVQRQAVFTARMQQRCRHPATERRAHNAAAGSTPRQAAGAGQAQPVRAAQSGHQTGL